MPGYRATFHRPSLYINDHHRFFADCPAIPPDCLIDIGIPGWLRREDALKLYEMGFHASGHILELGCYQGLSACILARAVLDANSASRITTVDLDSVSLNQASQHLMPFGSIVDVVCAEAKSACTSLLDVGRTFSFIFVDHSHTYRDVAAVCRFLPRLLTSGGFVLFHDFNDRRNNDADENEYGVSDAVLNTLDMNEFEFFGIFGCSALYRKRDSDVRTCSC
jgi:SAM-dependent methyltransferase